MFNSRHIDLDDGTIFGKLTSETFGQDSTQSSKPTSTKAVALIQLKTSSFLSLFKFMPALFKFTPALAKFMPALAKFMPVAALLAVSLVTVCSGALPPPQTVPLKSSWRIENSGVTQFSGPVISLNGFDDHAWKKAVVPSTVMANLVDLSGPRGAVNDPYMSNNWLKLPGSGAYYAAGKNFANIITPPESPFGHPWWYRTEFTATAAHLTQQADLHLDGVTYGAEIWINGSRLVAADQTRGSYRHFKFNISSQLKLGLNTLAILVSPPLPTDLTPSWVDWNVTPQDKNMGLWRDVYLKFHGPVSIAHAFVSSEIEFPKAALAKLTIESDITNATALPVTGTLRAETHGFEISMPVTLKPNEVRRVVMSPDQFTKLAIHNPKLWWPWQMGSAALHSLKLTFDIGKQISDEVVTEFGIRKVESHLTPQGSRQFAVNNRPIFIRGGGWTSDLLLRFKSDRQEREIEYVKDLGLNTIRIEGRFENDNLISLADKNGILVLPGWVCCNAWQNTTTWDDEHKKIARESLRDLAYELRSHASVFVFLYGSDEPPPPEMETIYLQALKDVNWPNPSLSCAAARITTVGSTGVKMTGPYSYVPPSYWYMDKNRFGGGWGFNTETSPGVSMPPLESLKEFIPRAHLSQIDDIWNFHMGLENFTSLDLHKDAIDRRYGRTKDAVDFVKKSQVMDYDNHRAMFEAYAHNKYRGATGVIQWMLNSAWPSMMWHLYDFYLRPNSAYYAVKKANAPLHVSLSHEDLTVTLVNSTYEPATGLHVAAQMLDLKSRVLFTMSEVAQADADSAVDILKLPEPVHPVAGVYFVRLELRNASNDVIDTNFYWLSTTHEIYKWDETEFPRETPVKLEGDFSALQNLATTLLKVTLKPNANSSSAVATITNTGKGIAFFIHLDLYAGKTEVIPVIWGDNNISLLPGETREITVHVPEHTKYTEALIVHGSAWNAARF